jgi:hypothetical protein
MSVKSSIITELEKGVRDKAGVIERVMKSEQVTVQAVYKELRALVRDEIVIDKQKKLSLTLTFIEGEYKKWRQVRERYTDQVSFDDLLELPKGKSHTFTFTTIVDLDLFWTQAFIILERILPEEVSRYSIVPHDWFSYARPTTDDVWTNNKTRVQRLLITHPAEVDWQIARRRRTEGYEFTGGENPLKLTEHQYITLVGDWVFEVEFDKTVSTKLCAHIKGLKKVEEADTEYLSKLMLEKGTFKLKLSNNAKKSKEYAGKVKKFFE